MFGRAARCRKSSGRSSEKIGVGCVAPHAIMKSVTPAAGGETSKLSLAPANSACPGDLLSFGVHKMSLGAAQIAFWAFAAVMGVSLSSIFLVFTGTSIAQVFFVTAIAFGGLSLWGYTTKKDLSGWGTFLIMGVIGIIGAALVNLLLQSSALQFAISAIGVLVFAGLTAYDTQRITDIYFEVAGDATAIGKAAILGALSLYLDFINMFTMLLQLFGRRE